MYPNDRLRRPQTRPVHAKRRIPAWILIVGVVLVAVLAGGYLIMHGKTGGKPATAGSAQTAPSFDKHKYSWDDPASPWVVINKKRPLNPKTYAPDIDPSAALQVSPTAATALQQLLDAARADGVPMILVSGYRSYNTQATTYNNEVRAFGQTQADKESARPGYSEHQSGWAADLGAASGKCNLQTCFGDLPEGKWLAANAYTYGFIIRYPADKIAVTGYEYEPWHIRYIGTDLAAEMHRTNTKTLEEFFSLPSAPNY